MQLEYLWYTYSTVFESFSTDIVCCIFNYMEHKTGSIIALHTDDQHILYYIIDVYRLVMRFQSSFHSLDYLVVQW